MAWMPCYDLPLRDVACLTHRAGAYRHDRAVQWVNEFPVAEVYLDRPARLGCPCKGQYCGLISIQCIDGRYRRFEDQTCPIPP
ncbi:hypothetical protein BH09MYX1_BH09MYX1_26210 [soil metagenome]